MSHRILRIQKIDFHWEMENPFLFCAHHKDNYPKGNIKQEPTHVLTGRQLGEDFAVKDGFRMYHGTTIPGFPMHPHRGFETVTIVKKGFVDHFDSFGAYGRYGAGDVQWLTTGAGCQHAEMFPLVSMEEENPLEIFQVWLNLPAKSKMVPPDYKMLWSDEIPTTSVGMGEHKSNLRIIAGEWHGVKSLNPNPNSYAMEPKHRVNIIMIDMQPHAGLILPEVSSTYIRNLYFYEGNGKITIAGEQIPSSMRIKLDGNSQIEIANGSENSYLLLLEAEPINEPVVSHGPFVMNTEKEIATAFSDYYHTGFGGWPWQRPDPVNPRDSGRFAKYIAGHSENK